MADATERLLVRIDATTEQLRREMKRAEDALGKSQTKVEQVTARIKKAFGSLNTSANKLGAAFGALGAGLAINKIIRNTEAQEAAVAQLNATLTSTQMAAGKTAEELTKTAASLQKLTRYGDESIIQMQSLLLTFKEIKGDNFDRTTRAVLDMATAMKTDLKSAALQVGKALNDPTANLGALSRAGIQFSESQKEAIKQMQAVGDLAGAQTLILKELESQFGGSAEAARDTLGGAIDGLSNAFNDLFEVQESSLGGIKQNVNELEKLLSDPKIVDSIHRIAEALLSIVTNATAAISKVVELTRYLSESFASAIAGPALDDSARVQERIVSLERELEQLEGKRRGRASERRREIQKELEILRGASKLYDELAQTRNKAAKAGVKNADVTKDEADATMDVAVANAKASKAREKAEKTLAKIKDTNKEYLEDLRWEAALLKYSERDKQIINALREKGAQLTLEEQEELARLVGTLYDESEATKEAAAAKSKLATEAKKAQEQINPFVKSLQDMAARIDEAFANAWKGAFDSFDDFADGLKDAFKNLIAELAHMAITRPIIMSIGASFGLGSSGAMASGMGSAGSIFSGISSAGGVMPWLSSGISSGFGLMGNLGNAYQSVGTWLAQGNLGNWAVSAGQNAISQGATYQSGGMAGWGQLGLNLGAGYVGNLLGGKAFGDTTGIGSSVGGFVGSFWGPLGTAIGSFVGTGLEKALGNLLGFGSGGNNSAIGDFDFGTGSLVSRGVGNNFSERNLEAVQQIEQVFAQFAQTLGGSDASFRVRVGNKSGFKLDGERFDDASALIAEGFKRIAEGATELSPELKNLIKAFDGTAEETAVYAQSIVNISKLVERNPIVDAVDDFSKQLELAGMTTRRIYDEQINAIEDMAMAFDGSLESTQALSQALSVNKSMAYELAVALQQVNQTIQGMVADQVLFFKQQTMSDDQLLKEYEQAFSFLWGGLSQQTDPAKIREIGEGLLWLNRELFNMGSPELQQANADFFIDRARAIEEATGQTIFRAGLDLQASQDDLNQKMQVMLAQASEGFNQSANTMQSAAEIFMAAVQYFTGNATGQYSEVTA